MPLKVTEIPGASSTVFQVSDEHGNVIANFDSRGGYTRKDADRLAESESGWDSPSNVRRRREPPYSEWGAIVELGKLDAQRFRK
jgi:hypothetical protein